MRDHQRDKTRREVYCRHKTPRPRALGANLQIVVTMTRQTKPTGHSIILPCFALCASCYTRPSSFLPPPSLSLFQGFRGSCLAYNGNKRRDLYRSHNRCPVYICAVTVCVMWLLRCWWRDTGLLLFLSLVCYILQFLPSMTDRWFRNTRSCYTSRFVCGVPVFGLKFFHWHSWIVLSM